MSAKPKSVHVYRGVRGKLFVDQFTMRDAYAPLAVGEYLGEYVPNEELADLRARALPQAVVDAVRHCMSVANGPTVDRIDAMHALRHAIEADAKGFV